MGFACTSVYVEPLHLITVMHDGDATAELALLWADQTSRKRSVRRVSRSQWKREDVDEQLMASWEVRQPNNFWLERCYDWDYISLFTAGPYPKASQKVGWSHASSDLE